MPQHQPRNILYNFEYPRRLRACVIGAGWHAYRNVYPAFRYAPVDLIAICDLDLERAGKYARQFGAERTHADHRAMLEAERPEIVFIVTNYTPEGRVAATALAHDCLEAGAHVWMEKPTAASTEEVRGLMAAVARSNRQVMTGLKKIFFPSIEKLRDIIEAPEFGRLTSLTVRYPQRLPPFDERADLRAMTGFLDHIYHPAAILNYLGGAIERAVYEWEPATGASTTAMRFRSGAVGTLVMAPGQSHSSPLERIEAVGTGANAIVENGTRLLHYRHAPAATYGRSSSWIQANEATAPVFYEPENSLGQLYNSNLFTLGYVPEILHFCDAVLEDRTITKGTLEDSLEIMRLFDFYTRTPPGVSAEL